MDPEKQKDKPIKKAVPSRTNMLPPDPLFRLKGDMGYIHSLCFSDQNHSQLMAATEKKGVHFWDLETYRLQHKQEMGQSIQAIHSIGNRIVTQEKCGVVKLWSVDNATVSEEKKYDYFGGYCKSILMDKLLAVPQEKSIELLDVDSFACVRKLEWDENFGNVMALQAVDVGDTACLMAGYETGDVVLWDITASKPCSHEKLQEHITSLTYDCFTRRGVCAASSSNLEVFSIDSAYNITLNCEISITNEGCNVVRMRPDKKLFVSGGWDGRVRLISWKSLRSLVLLTEHKAAITDVQYSPSEIKNVNSNVTAISDADGLISLWNLYN